MPHPARQPQRFVWPPRQPGDGKLDPAPARGTNTTPASPLDTPSGAIAAPSPPPSRPTPRAPLPPPADPAAPSSPPPAARPPLRHRAAAALIEIERVWLGQVTPPLPLRIDQAGWTPDGPHDYCPRCGATVTTPEPADGCPDCLDKTFPWERLIRLGEYNGLLKEVVTEVKFTRWRRLGFDIGRILGRSLIAQLDQHRVDPHRTVLVPVPTSFWRRMARGIDHPLVIARGIARETGLPIVQALERRHRPTQQSLPASKRIANLAGAMRPKRWTNLSGLNIVLVDDVTTTRATLRAAARALRRAPGGAEAPQIQRVWAAVVAVTPAPRR